MASLRIFSFGMLGLVDSIVMLHYNELYFMKYFTNSFLLKTLLIVLIFLLVVIAVLYLSRPGGSNKCEKAGWCYF